MSNTKTIYVPHLGGISAAYQMPKPYDSTKPTLLMVNAFTMSSELYRAQFDDPHITASMNLLAVEPLGHGQTRTARNQWTYWDTAEMNLQVLDALGIEKAFILGTSQGVGHGTDGPDATGEGPNLNPPTTIQTNCGQVVGIIPLGTSMDSESERSRQMQCWDGPSIVKAFLAQWASSRPTPNFEPDDGYCDAVISIGLNDCPSEVRQFWHTTIKSHYRGEEGKQRLRMAAINLAERDGLRLRLADVTCPIKWIQGTNDAVFSVANAAEEIQMFTGSPDAQLMIVDGGAHFLSASNPKEINAAVIEFVNAHWK